MRVTYVPHRKYGGLVVCKQSVLHKTTAVKIPRHSPEHIGLLSANVQDIECHDAVRPDPDPETKYVLACLDLDLPFLGASRTSRARRAAR